MIKAKDLKVGNLYFLDSPLETKTFLLLEKTTSISTFEKYKCKFLYGKKIIVCFWLIEQELYFEELT